jgi:hypothetical protein
MKIATQSATVETIADTGEKANVSVVIHSTAQPTTTLIAIFLYQFDITYIPIQLESTGFIV